MIEDFFGQFSTYNHQQRTTSCRRPVFIFYLWGFASQEETGLCLIPDDKIVPFNDVHSGKTNSLHNFWYF